MAKVFSILDGYIPDILDIIQVVVPRVLNYRDTSYLYFFFRSESKLAAVASNISRCFL